MPTHRTLVLTQDQLELLQLGLACLTCAVERDERDGLLARWPRTHGKHQGRAARLAQLEVTAAALSDGGPPQVLITATADGGCEVASSVLVEAVLARPGPRRSKPDVQPLRVRIAPGIVARARRALPAS
jgi:hypothetical protein